MLVLNQKVQNNNGEEKKITFSNLEDAIFGNVSGDATIAAGGALTIAATSVENSMLADDAVDTAQIKDDAVDSAQIENGAIDLVNMSADSVEKDAWRFQARAGLLLRWRCGGGACRCRAS